jgi:predicted RND superfamily exporter protein
MIPYRRTVSAVFMVLALVLFILAGFGAMGNLTWSHWQALGWFGLASLSAALLPL